MRKLGLLVSEPKCHQPHKFRFAEPAYFLLTPDNVIGYMDIASFPSGGRMNMESLLMMFQWAVNKAKDDEEFAAVVWGSA